MGFLCGAFLCGLFSNRSKKMFFTLQLPFDRGTDFDPDGNFFDSEGPDPVFNAFSFAVDKSIRQLGCRQILQTLVS